MEFQECAEKLYHSVWAHKRKSQHVTNTVISYFLRLQIMQWHKYCYLVHGEHSFQQINEFSPVCLLCQQLPSFKICWYIHLPNVIQTIEDVLPGLLWLNTSFSFMLFWCLIKKERKRTTSSSTLTTNLQKRWWSCSCSFPLGNICELVHTHKHPRRHHNTVTTHKHVSRRWCLAAMLLLFMSQYLAMWTA